MADDEPLQTNTYNWSQTNDQVTITFLVPDSVKSKDLEITFERQALRAGLQGQEPVFSAKLFQPINHFESLWQLERNTISSFSSLTASPTLSIASSYAFSPNSSMILPEPVDVGLSEMSELLAQTGGDFQSASETDDAPSQPNSPMLHTPPSIATPPHLRQPKYRVITIHLEKEEEGMEWAVPIAGPYKTDKMDITSSYLLGQWFETRMGDLVRAMDQYQSSAERGYTKAMLKVGALYETEKGSVVAKTFVEKDLVKSFEWYKKAADNVEQEPGTNSSNGPDPLACYIVGTYYGSGLPEADIEKNYQNALYYYNRCMMITAPKIDMDFSVLDQSTLPKSKLRNHAPHTRDERYFCSSAFQTGLIYLYGSQPEGQVVPSTTDVEVDADLAIRYWKEAALLGHAQACFNIGIMYANGMSVKLDVFEAGKWFSRAVKLDATGKLVIPDGVQPIDWDATPESLRKESASKATAAEKKERRKKRKSVKKRKEQDQESNDVLGALVALGSVITVAGIAWYFYSKRVTR